MKQHIKVCTLLTSLFISQWVVALPDDTSKPLNIQSNQARFDQKTGEAIYTGDVFVKQGTIEIQAQYLKVITNPKTRKFTELIATGHPAKFSQQIDWQGNMMISRGNKVVYKTAQSKVEIFGDGYLNRMDDKITADHIVYYINNGTFSAEKEGSGRVSMTLQPQTEKQQESSQKKEN